jgi:hypothetical protein
MVFHRKIFPLRSPEVSHIFFTVRRLSFKVIRMNAKLANFFIIFANEMFINGLPEFYDYGIKLMTKAHDFIKLDLTNPLNEKIYSILVANIMNITNSYGLPIARRKLLEWVDCYVPHLKEVVTAAETTYS